MCSTSHLIPRQLLAVCSVSPDELKHQLNSLCWSNIYLYSVETFVHSERREGTTELEAKHEQLLIRTITRKTMSLRSSEWHWDGMEGGGNLSNSSEHTSKSRDAGSKTCFLQGDSTRGQSGRSREHVFIVFKTSEEGNQINKCINLLLY